MSSCGTIQFINQNQNIFLLLQTRLTALSWTDSLFRGCFLKKTKKPYILLSKLINVQKKRVKYLEKQQKASVQLLFFSFCNNIWHHMLKHSLFLVSQELNFIINFQIHKTEGSK